MFVKYVFHLRNVYFVFVSGLSYLFSIALSRIHLSSTSWCVWPTRWQKSNLINQRDAVAPNEADDHDLNDKDVGSGDYVDNLGDDDDVVSADEQSNLWPTNKAEWDVHQRENIVSATLILPNSQTTLS